MNLDEILRTADRILNTRLFEISGEPVNLVTIITFFIIVVLAWIASRLVRRWVEGAFQKRGVDRGTTAVTTRLVHYTVMAVGLAMALQNVGVDLGALFAAGAILGIALGFAMQNIAQNFVSGLILLVERAIKPGDVLEVEGRVVMVEKMGIRTSVARTRDEEELIVPNSLLVQSTVKNYTLRDSLYRLRATVGVEYGSDMKQVMEVLREVASGLEWRFRGRDPMIFLTEFGNSSVNFEASVWMDDPWLSRRRHSEFMQEIWWALQEGGITIAFPQLDVHFDGVVEESLERLPRAS